MKKQIVIKCTLGKLFAIATLLIFGCVYLPVSKAQTNSDNAVLIVHDQAVFQNYSLTNVHMLRNLLGHFSRQITTIDVKPVVEYSQGEIENYRSVFYVGSVYEEISYYDLAGQDNYRNFVADAAVTTKDVIWINYNLWQMVSNWDAAWGAPSFVDKFGFDFLYIENANYNRVKYKNTVLYKGVVIHANPGSDVTSCVAESTLNNGYACAREINRTIIPLGSTANAPAVTYSTLNATGEVPYIVNSGNFWFVADMPFSYFSEEDRYLAFTDILHDMLRIDSHSTQPLALVRIEDVHANLDDIVLDKILAHMESESVPFSIAAIAVFSDPLGFYNNGIPKRKSMRNSKIAQLLSGYANKGLVDIVAHGFTHQLNSLENPYNGVSGDDFEFYRVIENSDLSLTPIGPVIGDSNRWARTRLAKARGVLTKSGLPPFAWEAPHYLASALDYKAIRRLYNKHYGRLTYFLDNQSSPDKMFGQFYPYMIGKDMYGYQVIPENLGNVEPDPNSGFRQVLPTDLIRNAKKLRVVRDGIASLYYHPYLAQPGYPLYIEEVIDGIKGLGYKFVRASSLNPAILHH